MGKNFSCPFIPLRPQWTTIGLILTMVTISGIIFICYSTVKILFYRRKEEIETLKLLGATRAFIRTPFVIEGGVIGVAADHQYARRHCLLPQRIPSIGCYPAHSEGRHSRELFFRFPSLVCSSVLPVPSSPWGG